MVHRNIHIINNTFKMTNPAVVSARSTDRLVFTGNKIIYADSLKGRRDIVAFDLTACTNVLIEKNNFDLPGMPLINTQKMTNTDLKTDLKVNIK
jgi:hypothetical protein